MIEIIRKRDGRLDEFNIDKIAIAINKAFIATNSQYDLIYAKKLALDVYDRLEEMQTSLPTVELVQDTVEEILIEKGLVRAAKAYIIYRVERTKQRDMNTQLMKKYDDLYNHEANAEYIIDNPLTTIIKYGISGASMYNQMFILNEEVEQACINGEINIHHLEAYATSSDSNHFDLAKLIDLGVFNGFSLKKISDYMSLLLYCVRLIKQEQYGEIEFMNFDTFMAKAISASFKRSYKYFIKTALELSSNMQGVDYFIATVDSMNLIPTISNPELSKDFKWFFHNYGVTNDEMIYKISKYAYDRTYNKIIEDLEHAIIRLYTEAGMDSFLPSTHSTISYGLDQSKEARIFDKTMLKVLTEYPVCRNFVNQIYLVKEGVNEDIFAAFRKQSKGIYFQFVDVNNRIYHASGASFDLEEAGNIGTTTINLPHLAKEANGVRSVFYKRLEELMTIVADQLKQKYHLLYMRNEQRKQSLAQNDWSYNITRHQYESLLKSGTLSIGFIGLDECCQILNEKKIDIIKFMRERIPEDSNYHFNLSTIYYSEVALELAAIDGEKSYSLGVGYEKVTDLESIASASQVYQYTEGGYKLGVDITNLDVEEVFLALKNFRIEFVKII